MTDDGFSRWWSTFRVCPKCGDDKAEYRMKITSGPAETVVTTQYECSCCKHRWEVLDTY